jgi:hypothetical protein
MGPWIAAEFRGWRPVTERSLGPREVSRELEVSSG